MIKESYLYSAKYLTILYGFTFEKSKYVGQVLSKNICYNSNNAPSHKKVKNQKAE
jgi:hypothetical protein